MLAAVSTENKLALGGVALIFILFALASALLIPRYRADFPGRGLPAFLVATLVLFVAMLGAVELFAIDEEEAVAHGPERVETGEHSSEAGSDTKPAETAAGAVSETIRVRGDEFDFDFGEEPTGPGNYLFVFENVGEAPHNLVVTGPEVANVGTPVIAGGKTARLEVALVAGSYKIYCSVPGHEEAGMKDEITID